jgi:hypothetical protein
MGQGIIMIAQVNLQKKHLHADAEFAEDLAIRYADACCGPNSHHFESMEQYVQARDECTSRLFQAVATKYGVTDSDVRAALEHRPILFDLATMLPFVALYGWITNLIVRRIRRRYADASASQRVIINIYASLMWPRRVCGPAKSGAEQWRLFDLATVT